MIDTTIEKLVFRGQGMGRVGGKVVFAWNALPDEQVLVKVSKNKKSFIDGVATEIVSSSPDRIVPLESHHLSCSPWQIVAWEQENQYKIDIARETYQQIGGFDWTELAIDADQAPKLGYRNKMEYSFTWTQDEADQLCLGFFNRGGRGFVPLPEGCALAEPGINQTALAVVEWLRKHDFPVPRTKSLIVRSNGQGQTIAALFIKEETTFTSWPEFGPECLGFQLYFSDPKSPAALPTKLLHTQGQDHLLASLRDTPLKFGLLSFFQVNIPRFEKALLDIAGFLDPVKPVVDFYAGVGAISLPLREFFASAKLVDNNPEAIAYAQDNIRLSGITNCEAVLSEAEKITEMIESDQIVILDPPRAGLHGNVIERLLEVRPERLIYLSCNLSTQARDIALLKEAYEIRFLKLYNFFPRTPHIEALCVLERR